MADSPPPPGGLGTAAFDQEAPSQCRTRGLAVGVRPGMSGVGTTDQVEPFQCSATGSIGPPRGAANPTAQASVSEVASSPNRIPEAFGSSTFGDGVSAQPEPPKKAARVRSIPEKV